MPLTTDDHDRDVAGMTYVYPVVSRRAGGVSVGINLNPNNACNFRCVYCQVPGLVRGAGPPIDLGRLEAELERMLGTILQGGFLERNVPEGLRRLHDVALSGNGEPTSSPDFEAAVTRVARVLEDMGLAGDVELILITNGSLLHKEGVQRGVERLAATNGRVWFKVDAATDADLARINDYHGGIATLRRNLVTCAGLCATWIQTCVFAWHGEGPDEEAWAAYVDLLRRLVEDGVPLEGVLLYGLARPSHQPEAPDLSRLEVSWLEKHAKDVERLGLPVQVAV